MTASLRFEPLAGGHDRKDFRSGDVALDTYFRTHASRDVRRRIANCYVLVEAATGRIPAFYTLSAASIPLVDLPPETTRRLPRYPTLPAVRIGRLAVDERFQRKGLGELLLMNAVHRTVEGAAAAFAQLVDAKNDRAAAFYRRYGFQPLVGRPLTLFLPIETAQKALR